MIGKQLWIIFFAFFSITFVSAQETWSLQKCVESAIENSNTIKLSDTNVRNAVLTEKQTKLQRTPFVSGRTSFNNFFGRSIDPTTNEFVNRRIGTNSFGVDASITLFSGGRIHNGIKQSAIDVQVAEASRQADINDLALLVANAYLQILQAEEQLANATNRLALSTEQLDRTDKLIKAGVLPANDRLDVLALMAADEQAITGSKNAIEINYLNLRQLLELAPDAQILIEKPNIDAEIASNPDDIKFSTVYNSALTIQPQLKASALQIESANLDINIAKGALLPSLNLFGGLSTNYSSAAKDFFSYSEQLDNNFSQNLGVGLNIPIYSQGQNNINIQRAELGVISAQISDARAKQSLSSDVQNAIANARAANQNLKAAEKTLEARRLAYENSKKRFDLGAINTFELTTAKNNMDTSEVDVVVAKYEYIFRLKIIDFYMGRPLKME